MKTSLKAALRDYSLLWRAALATRPPRADKLLSVLALLGTLVLASMVYVKTHNALDAVLIGPRAILVVFGFGWLMYFVPGALKLNTPANARLVPRMTHRLRQLTALAWGTTTLLSTLLALGSPIPVYVAFLCTGFWLIAFGLARSGNGFGNWLQLLLPMAVVFHPEIPQGWLEVLASASTLAIAGLLVLALGAYTLETMFPHEGDRHFRLLAAQKLVAEQMVAGGQTQQVRTPRPFQRAYRAVLQRDCARRDADGLVMHLLGPDVHTSQRRLFLVAMVVIVAPVIVVARQVMGAEALAAFANSNWAFLSSALLVHVFDQERRLMRLSFTRGEQSLVRLAPAVPDAAREFNRRLAGMLLRTGVIEWVAVSATVLGLTFLAGARVDFLWKQACVSCLALPLAATALRDHAHRSGSAGRELFLGLLVSGSACVGLGLLARASLDLPVLPVAAFASVLVAIAAVSWRWRRLVVAPHAFPVGRLA